MLLIFLAGSAVVVFDAPEARAASISDHFGLTYAVDDTHRTAGARVTGYDTAIGGPDVTIPSTVAIRGISYPVTGIGTGAFQGKHLVSVTLPDSLSTIASAAFHDNYLTDITIPARVVSIGSAAFAANPLESVSFEGDAPQISPAGPNGSFGPASGKVLSVFSNSVGFTAPKWRGYNTSIVIEFLDVAFDSSGGTQVGTGWAWVVHGDTITEPAPPTRAGYTFTGWYTDRAATSRYDFGTPVTKNLNLYAGWSRVTHTVTFDSGGSIRVNDGEPVTEPSPPTRAGYTFTGWYTDESASIRYDFTTPVFTDITLHAGWELYRPEPTSSAVPSTPPASSTVPSTPPATSPAPSTPPATSAVPSTPPASSAVPSTPPATSVPRTPDNQPAPATHGPSPAPGILTAPGNLPTLENPSNVNRQPTPGENAAPGSSNTPDARGPLAATGGSMSLGMLAAAALAITAGVGLLCGRHLGSSR